VLIRILPALVANAKSEMKSLPKNGLTVIDAFCGAGVGAVGSEMAGFSTIYAFDNNHHAVRNFNKNISNVAVCLDARDIDYDSIPDADVITGGFPCKPWSTAGSKLGIKDEKNGDLGELFVDLILHKKPKAFLMENVAGIVNKRNIKFFNMLVERMSDLYDIKWKLVNCADYGIPQKRERVFVIGIRKEIGSSYVFPQTSSKKVSIKEALAGLPEIPDGLNNHEYHQSFAIRKDETPYISKIPIGGNWKCLPENEARAFMKGAFNNGGGRTGFLRVIDPNLPAKTIMSTPMGKSTAQILRISDGSSRRFTVRESLRLQTVPDFWCFDKETPISVQYERCSGIPSLMSYQLMIEIGNALNV